MIRSLIACFILLSGCTSQVTPEYMISSFLESNKVPGIFVAIVQGDSVLYQSGFGVADNVRKQPITAETCMELGSISKAFTGQTIYALHQKGIINVNDPISKYFPDAPSTWSRITIRNLLTHSSGIQNYLLDPRFKAAALFGADDDPKASEFLRNTTPDSMIRMFYSLPIEFSPGTTWSYSNTGYYLLGRIAESATGKSYFDLTRENQLVPLQMKHTIWNERASEQGCLAKGHYPLSHDLKVAPVLTSNIAFSAGAWATTGTDMINYMKAMHKRQLPLDKLGYDWRNIPANEMPFTYDAGSFHTTYHGMKIISHNGGTPGFSSSWIYLPNKNLSIIIMMNRQDYAPIDHLAWDVLTTFEPSLIYPYKKIEGEEENRQTERLMKLLKAIESGAVFPEGLSQPLKIFLESENGKGLWKWYFAQGFPDEAQCVDVESTNFGKIYRFRLSFSNKVEYRISIQTNRGKEIVQLRWW